MKNTPVVFSEGYAVESYTPSLNSDPSRVLTPMHTVECTRVSGGAWRVIRNEFENVRMYSVTRNGEEITIIQFRTDINYFRDILLILNMDLVSIDGEPV